MERIKLFLITFCWCFLAWACGNEDEQVINLQKNNCDCKCSENLKTYTDPRDGHVYPIVSIGKLTWMTENLAYLPSVNAPGDFSDEAARYYVYDYSGNDTTEAKATETYTALGVLYNWVAACSSCPDGWRTPTLTEWHVLVDYINSLKTTKFTIVQKDTIYATAKAVSAGCIWFTSTQALSVGNLQTDNNQVCLYTLPAGWFYKGSFIGAGAYSQLWTGTEINSTSAWGMGMSYNALGIDTGSFEKNLAMGVRCVRNN